jgi:hypothetical protein
MKPDIRRGLHLERTAYWRAIFLSSIFLSASFGKFDRAGRMPSCQPVPAWGNEIDFDEHYLWD